MKNDLPIGWKVNTLGEVTKIFVGRDLQEKNFSKIYSEIFKFPIYSNSVENKGLYGFYNFIEFEGESLTVVGRGAGLGRAFFRNHRFGAIGRLLILFPKENMNAKYLTDYINSQINFHIESSGIPQLTGEQISTYKILIPPLPEQQKIAQILSTWDKAIQTTQHLLDKLESRKKGMMQRLLSGKIRVKGFENSKWKLKKIHELITPIIREVPKPNEAFLGLGLRSHVKGTFLKHNFDPNKIEMESLFTVRENDLIVNITFAWEGAIAIATLEDDGALVSHRFPTYTFIEGKSSSDYFKHFIRLARLRFLLELISPGGAGRNRVMSKKDFIQLEFLFPPIEEQTAIAKILNTADAEIQETKAYLKTLKHQKKGLMQSLLTGRIIVKTREI